jgi:hypothetical protein
MVSIFFSYSHRDEDYRNELEIHLTMLKREGIIGTWHDRRIGAGKGIDSEVSEHLQTADIVLLLVSPYFLASDYCFNLEMKRALERHEKGETVVIPVIVHPCDWNTAPFGRLRATPPDGKPISKFPNMHDAYLAVVTDIRQAASRLAAERGVAVIPAQPTLAAAVRTATEPRSSNLRLKKTFTDKDKDDFLDSGFEYIANFFEGSLDELRDRNPGIATRFIRIDKTHFTAAIYVAGTKRATCRIWHSGRNSFSGGIGYSVNDSGSDSGFNEALSVIEDGYSLQFKPLGLASRGRSVREALSQQGGAEYLWSVFILPLQ